MLRFMASLPFFLPLTLSRSNPSPPPSAPPGSLPTGQAIPTAAIYARYSSSSQSPQTIATQIEVCTYAPLQKAQISQLVD